MQKVILFVLVVISSSLSVKAQSLKEALYGGKLKMDSNSVLKKTDDIKSRIDTAQKKQVEPAKSIAVNNTATVNDSSKKIVAPTDQANVIPVVVDTAAITEAPVKETAVPIKSNNKIWKEYSDALLQSLQSEVLSNKKIKKESYYVLVTYEMDTTSQVSISNVVTTPTNALLQSEILRRMQDAPPTLNPMLDSNGKPRKIKRTYSFTVVKD